LPVVNHIEVSTAVLPFRLSFGHALAERRSSTNVYTKVTLDDGSVGFGEGVPRDYVTGETPDSAVEALSERYLPAAIGREVRDVVDVPTVLADLARDAEEQGHDPAAWCALELALLDAFGKSFGCSVRHWLGPTRSLALRYDAIIPFVKPAQLVAAAMAIRVLGFRQVKLKVGVNLATDLKALGILRGILGPRVDLRVDANCAWNADQALDAIQQMRRYRISAVEQPVAADDFDGLRRVTAATPETIIVDESLRTIEDARALVDQRACDAFNLRVSKCGGLLTSMRIARIGADADLGCVVGAQVGESGILSAAGRQLASCLEGVRYLEGSAGRLLLKEDLTVENVMPGWGGRARQLNRPGLGVRVREDVLRRFGQACHSLEAGATPASVSV
jgi:L-Ala-D/L-Glu epimerase